MTNAFEKLNGLKQMLKDDCEVDESFKYALNISINIELKKIPKDVIEINNLKTLLDTFHI